MIILFLARKLSAKNARVTRHAGYMSARVAGGEGGGGTRGGRTGVFTGDLAPNYRAGAGTAVCSMGPGVNG